MLPIFISYSGKKCKPEIPAEGAGTGVYRFQRQKGRGSLGGGHLPQ